MEGLPAPPAAPLHILPPAILLMLLAGVALVLLALIWWLLRRFRRRRAAAEPPPPAPTPTPTPTPTLQPTPAAAPAAGLADRIEAIERKFLKTKEFRDGCHVLADAAKAYLGKRTGLAVERMTSPEIAAAVEDQQVGRFMVGLSRRRYGRDEPRRKHFVEACREAREVLA